jgi:hypothetical protein
MLKVKVNVLRVVMVESFYEPLPHHIVCAYALPIPLRQGLISRFDPLVINHTPHIVYHLLNGSAVFRTGFEHKRPLFVVLLF